MHGDYSIGVASDRREVDRGCIGRQEAIRRSQQAAAPLGKRGQPGRETKTTHYEKRKWHSSGGVAAHPRGAHPVHPVVSDLQQQQCHRQDGAERVPVSHDGDHDPAVQHYAVQWTLLQFVGHTQVPGSAAQLLPASHNSALTGQVPGLGHFAHIPVESTCLLCPHR